MRNDEAPSGTPNSELGIPNSAGRPYFVLELVQGVPITEYCDQCQLTTRERLDLFVLVCQAVQHAHQKGVIHRDLKPSNVLVAMQDGKPAPKIIDFGVAKAINQRLTERTLATGYAQMVGTPMYMSPEQAELSPLGVDTRTDVYSLGVLLYELLTGTTPFDKDRLHAAGYDELRRIIREEDPPRPSARLSTLAVDLATTIAQQRRADTQRLLQSVRGELDWIVMKCLEKDRNRRYDTANSLARDVTRYLADEPIEACPPSAMYRFQKFARRNKGFLTAAVLVALVLLSGAVVSTWQLVRAMQAEQRTDEQRQRAEANLQKAHDAVNRYFTLVSEDPALRDEPNLQPLRRRLLESALAHYEEFVRDEQAAPELSAEQAATCFRIAILRIELGTGENWLPWFERGVTIVEKLLAENHDVSVFESLHSGQRWIGGAAYRSSIPDFDEAARILKRARAAWEELVRRHRTIPGFQSDLAAFNIATAAVVETTDAEQARVLYAKAIRIWQELADAHRDVPHYRAALVNTMRAQSIILSNMQKLPEAELANRQAIDSAQSLVDEFGDTPGYLDLLGMAHGCLGRLLAVTGRPNEAEKAFGESLRIQEALQIKYPTAARYRTALLWARWDLADFLWETGRQSEAKEQYRQMLALSEPIPSDDLFALDLFARFFTDCPDPQVRDPQRAAELGAAMIELAPSLGDGWYYLGVAHYRAGEGHDREGRNRDAAEEYRAAIEGLKRAIQLDVHWASHQCRFFRAMAHARLGEDRLARQHFQEGVAQLETQYGPPIGSETSELLRARAEAERVLGISPPWNIQRANNAPAPDAPANDTQPSINK